MRKFKKALAFALASAMIVSAVPASAAAKTNSAKGTKSTIYTYTVDKSKKGNANNKRSWIKVTTKKGYTYKLVNKTKNIVTLTRTRVEAKKTGTAKINVKFYKNGKYVETKSVKITVKKAPMIGKVTLSKDTVNVGETATVSNAGKGKAYFYSSNKDVATVDKTTGEIKALAGGTTTISAVNTITKARVYLTLTVVADSPVATQVGAKTIEVSNGVDMTNSEVKVTKGNITVDLAKVDGKVVTDGGKKLVLTTAAKLTDGEYTVTVGDKTSTFKGQTEKVDKITIDSDVAILKVGSDVDTDVRDNDTNYNRAYAYYTVRNQFGEDITKNTTVSTQGAFVDAETATTEGKINFIYDKNATDETQGFRLGDTVTALVMYNEDGNVVTSETKTLKISNVAVVNEIEIDGLYNADGAILTEDTLDTKDFYVLFSVKDQYGNTWDEVTVGKNSDSQIIATLAPGVTDVDLETSGEDYAVKTIKKDGKEYLAVKLRENPSADSTRKNKYGSVLLTLIGSGSGAHQSYSFNVEEGVKVSKLTIGNAKDTIAVNDGFSTELEYTAVGVDGKEIKDFKTLKSLNGELNTTTENSDTGARIRFVEDYKTGEAKLMYTPAARADGRGYTEIITGLTEKYDIITKQFSVRDQAYPKAITGISDDFANAVLVESKGDDDYNHIDINSSDLTIQDQYGRNKTVNYTDKDGATYTISIIEKSENETGVFDLTTNTTKYGQVIAGTTLDGGSADTFKATLNPSAEDGSKTVKATIWRTKDGKTTKVDEYSIDLYGVHDTKINSYKLKEIGNMYYEAGVNNRYGKEVVVYGYASGGVKVLMPHYYYGVTTNNTNLTVHDTHVANIPNQKLPASSTGCAITVANDVDLTASGKALEKVNDMDVTVKATITSGAAIGTQLSETIKVSKEKITIKEAQAYTEPNGSIKSDVIYIDPNADVNMNTKLTYIGAVDQYGVKTFGTGTRTGYEYIASRQGASKANEAIAEAPKLTIFDIDESGKTVKVEVKNNGTANTIVKAQSGQTFKMKVTFASGYEYVVAVHAR